MADSARMAGMGVLLGFVLFTSACGGGEPTADGASTSPGPTSSAPPVAADPTTPATTSTAPSPTSSRTLTGPKAIAEVNARKVLAQYFRVRDTCLIHPKKAKRSCFDKVAVGTALRDYQNALSNAKAYGLTQIGRMKVNWTKSVHVDLANKPKQQPPVIPTVVFEVCYDSSRVNIVDSKGKSVVLPDRIPHGRYRVSVYNYEYPDQSQWRVGYSSDPVKDTSC